jgi:hypothetical protein
MLEDESYVIVVRRVIEALTAAKLTGWEATPVKDIRF